METAVNTFTKQERLCGEIRINELFNKGKAFTVFPFRVIFCKKVKTPSTMPSNRETPAKILISVPKKRLKRANARNFVKRRVREAYRLHKQPLYSLLETKDFSLDFALLYLTNEKWEFAQIEPKIIEVIETLHKKLQ
jgi:ribonuclease P protein component